jgi:hypothetical protein
MKKISVMILCALIISLIAPLQTVTLAESQSGDTVILTLDVCSPSGSSLSANNDLLSIYECPCKIIPLALLGLQHIAKPAFSFLLIPTQLDRPPKI